MKRRILLALVLAAPFATLSQKSPVKFGKVTMDELKMTRYEKDSAASAVVLVDYGEAYISLGATSASLTFERQVRIKILRKDGVSWADVSIPLMDIGTSEENISGLKAVAYNLENGEIVESKLEKDGIFKEKFNKNINLLKFSIPNAKEGSVLEFTYRINSDFLTNFPNWQFQYKIPVAHSEYWAIIPEVFTFQKYMQGYVSATHYEIKPISGTLQAQGHHWIIKDVPAFKEEPYMTSDTDYLSRVNFALSHFSPPGSYVREIMGSWEKMNSNFLEHDRFGGTITGSGFLKKTVDEITAGMSEPEQKIAAIHNYVRQNIEWNGNKDFLADPVREIIERRKGSSGDINLTLASMLEKAGIPVSMVLLSTRDHGFIRREYPMQRQFNYAVCEVQIGDKLVMLDATQRNLPAHILPERCLNQVGFRISKTNSGWVEIKPSAKSRTVVSANLTLDPSGELSGVLSYTLGGYDAGKMRAAYFSKGEAEYLKSALEPTWQIENSTFEGIKDLEAPVKTKHELTIPEHAVVAGDLIYISPFVTERIEENPFKREVREYPVDFGSPIEKTYICQLTIPEGYEIDEMPQSKIFMLPGNTARFLYNAGQTGSMITVTSTLQINRNLFLQTEYPNLREFYNQVVAKEAEQIVLKKKTN